jgi:hypothetical protein
MEKKLIEVEGNEMAIFSSKGIMAIVPKNKVNWVKKKLNEGCHECIDSLVESLPSFDGKGQKAADGVVLDTDPPPTAEKDPPKRRDPNELFYEDETEPGTDTYVSQYSTNPVEIVAERSEWRSPLQKAMSRLNPKNWFLEDYSDQMTKDDAYAAARAAGQVEYMYRGRRYNTKMEGTPKQQLEWSGTTDERIHRGINRPNTGFGVGAIKEFIEGRLEKNIDPVSYENMEKRFWGTVVLNEMEESRKEREAVIAGDKNMEDKAYMGTRMDAFNLYIGKPQKYNTFSVSDYKPSRSKQEDMVYYSLNKFKDPSVARDLVERYERDIQDINDQIAFRKLTEDQIKQLKERHLYFEDLKKDGVITVGTADVAETVSALGDFINKHNKHTRTRPMSMAQVEVLKDYVRLMNEPELAERMGLIAKTTKEYLSDEETDVLRELMDFGETMTAYDPATKSFRYTDSANWAGVMGNFNVSKGVDPQTGRPYIAYRDLWDLQPADFGKPYEIYDRIYLDQIKPRE